MNAAHDVEYSDCDIETENSIVRTAKCLNVILSVRIGGKFESVCPNVRTRDILFWYLIVFAEIVFKP